MKKLSTTLIISLLLVSCSFSSNEEIKNIDTQTGSNMISNTGSENSEGVIENEEELADETIQEIEDLFDLLESE